MHSKTIIDLWFPVSGRSLPADHGYALYSALCTEIPELHGTRWWGLHTAWGRRDGQGSIQLGAHPRIGLRMPAARLALVLPLVGRALVVGGHTVRLRAPEVSPLVADTALSARAVTIKGYTEPIPFAEAVAQQLAAGGSCATIEVGARKVVSVSGRRVVGFSLRLAGLDEEQALSLMEEGLGGRRRFGCGLLLPSRRALGETLYSHAMGA